ncbi:MAG: DUF2892 domain-containing protein [Thermoflexales bacterium]|nr:DUF2892 domain-containing protein [Thermoflexales bacterium]
MGFAQFMASGLGRGVRIAAGVAFLAWGLLLGGGIVPVILGAVFVAVGVFDVCLLAPLFGAPLKGADVRAKAK